MRLILKPLAFPAQAPAEKLLYNGYCGSEARAAHHFQFVSIIAVLQGGKGIRINQLLVLQLC